MALVGLLLAAVAAPVVAQEPAQSGETKTAPAPSASVQEWIDRLGDPARDVRQRAEAELRKIGADAVDPLRSAAEHHGDPEVRARAQRLADQLQRGDHGRPGLRLRGQPPLDRPFGQGNQNLDDVFERVFGQLEDNFGLDIPRQHFFNDDFFKDLQQQMQGLRQQVGGIDGQGQSTQIQVGPNGVKVEVTEQDENGKSETKTYEAPDMQTFRDKYPDVAKRMFANGDGLRLRFGSPLQGQGLFPRALATPMPPQWAPAPRDESRGPHLGVQVRAVSDDLRQFLGLADGQGLLVAEVVPGSLAETLGIQTDDVLLDIDGNQVGAPEDVRDALSKADKTVTVHVNRRGKTEVLSADAPADLKTDSGKLKPSTGPKRF